MKPATNRFMSIVRVFIIVTGLLLTSWDAEPADIPGLKQFFNGCSVVPSFPNQHLIRGACIGHSFATLPDRYGMCVVGSNKPSSWQISDCIFDGKYASWIEFDRKTGKLVQAHFINSIDVSRLAEKAKPSVPVEGNIVREVQTSGRYKGCTISYPADNPYQRVINGKCAGHVFENPPIGGPHEEKHVCRLQELPGQMFIGDCIIDGRHRRGATTIADGDPNSQTQADAEILVKQRTEALAKYPDLVASARARSKADPVVLGIILGTVG